MLGGPYGAVIGGVAGGIMGFMGGSTQKKARKAQERALREQHEAQRREQARREAAVQQARVQFGDVWNVWAGADRDEQLLAGHVEPSHPGLLGGFIGQHQLQQRQAMLDEARRQALARRQQRLAALRNYALWSGSIQRHAQQAGASMLDEGLAATQQQARLHREQLLKRGLLGSSLERAAWQDVNARLGTALGGAHLLAQQHRQQATHALRERQRQFEALARQGTDTSGVAQALAQQHQLAAQQAMIVPTMFGNLMNAGLQFAMYNALANAQRPTGGAAS